MIKAYKLVDSDTQATPLYDSKMSEWLCFLVFKILNQRVYDSMLDHEEAENPKYIKKLAKEIAKEIHDTVRSYLEGKYFGFTHVDDAIFLSDKYEVLNDHFVDSMFIAKVADIAKEAECYITRFFREMEKQTEATGNMTVSKMIKKLKELEQLHGDLPMKAFRYCGQHLEAISDKDVHMRFHESSSGLKEGKEIVIEGTY